jgi:hypothetical protein
VAQGEQGSCGGSRRAGCGSSGAGRVLVRLGRAPGRAGRAGKLVAGERRSAGGSGARGRSGLDGRWSTGNASGERHRGGLRVGVERRGAAPALAAASGCSPKRRRGSRCWAARAQVACASSADARQLAAGSTERASPGRRRRGWQTREPGGGERRAGAGGVQVRGSYGGERAAVASAGASGRWLWLGLAQAARLRHVEVRGQRQRLTAAA